MKTSILLSAMAAVAYARCSNDCNGKGTCNSANQCNCFRNFAGPDCSLRVCPFSTAFIDNQIGDKNGDNEISVQNTVMEGLYNTPQSELYSKNYATARDASKQTQSWDEAHFNRECSNKGLCDDTTGLCTCFPGYEGTACARISCPKGCSGHGQCKNYEGTQYKSWDITATTYCDCDAGYSGAGCENRNCPSGIDPVQAANLDTSRFQRIAFRGIDSASVLGTDRPVFADLPLGDVYFTVTLTDEYGDDWTTETLTVKYDVWSNTAAPATDDAAHYFSYPRVLNGDETVGENQRQHVAEQLQDALEDLPHGVSGAVTVHEIYTMSSMYTGAALDGVSLAGDTFAPASAATAFFYTNHADLYCGLDDIYDQTLPAASTKLQGITGCGLAIPSFYGADGDNEGLMGRSLIDTQPILIPDRQGNWDTADVLAKLVLADGSVISNPDAISNREPDTGAGSDVRDITNDAVMQLALVLPVCEQLDTGDAQSQTVLSLYDHVDLSAATPTNVALYDGTNAVTVEVLEMSGAQQTASCGDSAMVGYAYYQWPHYNNDEGAGSRFPLFFDPEYAGTFIVGADPVNPACDPVDADTGNFVDGKCNQPCDRLPDGSAWVAACNPYGAYTNTLKHNRHLVFDPTYEIAAELVNPATRNNMAGLSLFVYLEKDSSLHTASDNEEHPLRVDYWYTNQVSNLFDDPKGQEGGIPSIRGREMEGYYHDGTSYMTPTVTLGGGAGSRTYSDMDYEIVRVDDFTGARVWDVSYHGLTKYFLGQHVPANDAAGMLTPPSEAIDYDHAMDAAYESPVDADAILHTCSKRGLCDYTTGQCNCFSGYTGAGCGDQNALAF